MERFTAMCVRPEVVLGLEKYRTGTVPEAPGALAPAAAGVSAALMTLAMHTGEMSAGSARVPAAVGSKCRRAHGRRSQTGAPAPGVAQDPSAPALPDHTTLNVTTWTHPGVAELRLLHLALQHQAGRANVLRHELLRCF